ncbi:MAG: 1-deoxy-D-xylulose-5-phosphate synthase [Desulfohalobium sp.]
MNISSSSLLEAIATPQDVQRLSLSQLTQLAQELRQVIIDVVSTNGGHLAPSLGVVELTLALLKSFNPEQDRFVWDVGHQAYAYKLLTGRRDSFHTLRCLHGVSGFPNRSESPYDHFGVGHSSTSISAALGMAVGRDLARESNKVLAVIGDGSMTAGLAYEGLNQAGGLDRDLVVVLNDNEMSISKNVGALSSFLSRQLSSRWLVRFKREIEGRLRQIPRIGDDLVTYAKRSEESFKGLFTPGMLFEAFKFNYLGPIDGHDLRQMTDVFKQIRSLDGPVLVHVLTQKGHGYPPAEENPTYYHGVGCFEPETGKAKKTSACSLPPYTKVFGQTLDQLARRDERLVAITAAMPEGTGLGDFAEAFPERFFDVGICEQHAVTFAAGLATEGYRPFVAIYSTFLQRSYDQIVHDVCLQNLPVTLCLDRGGLVGEDGATHHGAFDLSFLRHIPNLAIMAPKDEPELQDMLATALAHNGPVAVRYPRGVGPGHAMKDTASALPWARGEWLRPGGDAVVVAVGSRVQPALEAAELVATQSGLEVGVLNLRFIKPLPEQELLEAVQKSPRLLVVEENTAIGGAGSGVLECLAEQDALRNVRIKRLGLPDTFVGHGPQKALRAEVGLDARGIAASLRELLAD